MADVKQSTSSTQIRPITRLLIANRGEIARRIIRSAQQMGIATVAIYADGDVDAPFVHEADTAIALNGETSLETYLDGEKVLAACERSNADAIHPGYGFLSENSDFAKQVIEAGIAWVGPSPEAIASMGDKLSAKQLMQEADVPMLPAREIKDGDDLESLASEIGYPILVKASAGGGGRGMRVVESAEELSDAVDSARREAASAFGDDTVFLERWLASSRHVEIQILGDTHGNLVHCFERECSIQRRHQKIIEEAPSSAVDDELRQRMGEAALSAARKIGYSSAGTVEFLLSGSEFFFLEVNTRLQVEHPVTEAITGLDLVREQIRIAEGEPLSVSQEDLSINGHAIEARLYAEDPARDFLPSPGTLSAWQLPALTQAGNAHSNMGGDRIDSGVEAGSEVSMNFDPMMAKFIVHAATRREAASRLARLLESTRIQGLTTNRDFLVATLRTAEFLSGDTNTDFIEKTNPASNRALGQDEYLHAAIACLMEAQARRRAAAKVLTSIPSGWRNTIMPFEQHEFELDGDSLSIEYRLQRSGKFEFRSADSVYLVGLYEAGTGQVDLDIDGVRRVYSIDQVNMTNLGGCQWLVHGPLGDIELSHLPRFPNTENTDEGSGLMAPMPGVVVSTEVFVGEAVEKGQLLLVLEAMKMEHRIIAPRDGSISELHVKEGEQVANGQLLVRLDDDGSEIESKEAEGK